jgi:uncharacterized protein
MDDRPHAGDRLTYVLVDGENIDATLGTSILQRRPQPDERPRWDRVLKHCRDAWGQEAKGLFFLAANDELPMSFAQALVAIGFQVVPLSGAPHQKVVDIAIQRTAEALRDRPADVMLVSHDGDFLPQMQALADGRRIGVMGFAELLNAGLRQLPGVEVHDLEHDVHAFNVRLPRLRVIPIDDFDPADYL